MAQTELPKIFHKLILTDKNGREFKGYLSHIDCYCAEGRMVEKSEIVKWRYRNQGDSND